MILLHGLFASKDNFHSLSRRLSHQFTVYALDLRNHGESFHDPEMSYQGMAADTAAFIEELGLGPAAVFGHSIGGKVAMELALSQPVLISALVVEDIAPKQYPPRLAREVQALAELPVTDFTTRPEAEKWMIGKLANPAVARFLMKNLVSAEGGGYFLRLNIEAIQSNLDTLLDFPSSSRSFQGPALFIRGGSSDYIQDDDFSLITRYFPNSHVETLDGATHWVHAEQPDAVADLVLDFF
ncbi:alpha/beta fold hydrolase [Marispirochaeta sp.]|uniref:alpha/beta fold hydrolase n=1 Tax=Marispirochaeta sp. TaxID=2038653 RepID=UPI0029C76E7D|nr:alpha/beta fold hydrolase [Marispirochaeta sp.]